MRADTYAWFLSAGYADRVSPPPPSATEIALAIIVAVGLVALLVVVLTWEPRTSSTTTPTEVEPSPLTRTERRALARITRSLEASDPELASLLRSASPATGYDM